jgi:hypothetical protein
MNTPALPSLANHAPFLQSRQPRAQGVGVYFFNVNTPRKTAYFKEKIHREK